MSSPAPTPTPAPASAPTPAGAPAASFAWQTCLDVANSDGHIYQHHFNPALLEVLAHPPRTLLDIGCASGLLGQAVKTRNPGCRTIGIEPNAATAKLAAANLDQVLCGKFEDFNLEAEGIALGSIDTVVAADVLEHMYDPWHVMTGLKPYLSKDAQIILSIPNTRHMGLLKALIDDGQWTYAEKGLLDITHIRFFTLAEINNFLAQTGYKLEHVNFFLDASLEQFYMQNQNKAEINVRVGRMTLERLTPKELAELCTWQFFIRARPL
ncbi:MAG: class I SAM-dependent methyltransferase [Betaproteobacteria bacterium]